MVAPYPTHDLVCIGVHASREYEFHAANAHAIGALFAGGQGPSRLVSHVLTGPRVTYAAVATAIDAAANRRAKNYIFYFSGQANPSGFEVSDGAISGEMFERHVAHVQARSVLMLLDLAVGAQPDQALVPCWLRALVEARKGLRVAAARATRIGGGVRGAGLARFTSAFVDALETAGGDLPVQGAAFISDKRALTETQRILTERWGVTHLPLELGTFGDMPLARSQAASPIGSASIDDVIVGAGASASVSWRLEGRAHMRTTLHYALEDAAGRVIAADQNPVTAKDPLQKGRVRVSFPRKVLKARAKPGAAGGTLHWRVSLRDACDRVLAERLVNAS